MTGLDLLGSEKEGKHVANVIERRILECIGMLERREE